MVSPSSYAVTGVITNAAIQAAITSGTGGIQISVSSFVIGGLDATAGAIALPTDTVVANIVYTGTAAQMQFLTIDSDTVMWRITLDTTVGNFTVGTIGLVMQGGVLFAEAVLPGPSVKYMNAPPTTVGNIKFYNIVLRMTNLSDLINLSVVESLDAALPEVANELALPVASSSPFDCYMVDNHTHLGVPTMAERFNGNWYHAAHRLNPGQGTNVITTLSTAFDVTVPTLAMVYLSSSTNLYEVADGSNTVKYPIGFRTSTFEITANGLMPAAAVGLTVPLTTNTLYYCGSGASVGKLVTTAVGDPVAVAVSTTDVYLSMSDNFGGLAGVSTEILYHACTDAGTANAYNLTSQNPALVSLPVGTMVSFKALHAPVNTNASTLTVGSFGPHPLLRDDGTAPQTTDMLGSVVAVWDGTQWYIPIGVVTPSPPPTPTASGSTTSPDVLIIFGIDRGVIYEYVVQETNPVVVELILGMAIQFQPLFPPDGRHGCFITVEGFGPYPVFRSDGGFPVATDMPNSGICHAVWNGTQFIISIGVYDQALSIPTLLSCHGDDSGIANNYIIAEPDPFFTTMPIGRLVSFIPNFPPTGAPCYLTLGGFGPFPLFRSDFNHPLPNDMQGLISCTFDGSRFLLPSSSKPGRLINTWNFTSNTTYYPSAGTVLIKLVLIGGGAGGAGVNNSSLGGILIGAPGTSGCYATATIPIASIGASVLCTIGAAGLGGLNSSTPPTAGGSTSFGSLVLCPGGVIYSTIGTLIPIVWPNGLITGIPTGIIVVDTFVIGCAGTHGQILSLSQGQPGCGGDSHFGRGGRGVYNGVSFAAASGYGSGGGGGISANASGASPGQNGVAGFMQIQEFGY